MSLSTKQKGIKQKEYEHVGDYYPEDYIKDLHIFCRDRKELTTHNFAEFDNKIDLINSTLFLYFLSMEIVLDQTVYTYFKDDYLTYQALTQRPKISFCGHGHKGKVITSHPWSILEFLSTGIGGNEPTQFKNSVRVFLESSERFFGKNTFETANWNKVKTAMLNDKDIRTSAYGAVFVGILSGSLS